MVVPKLVCTIKYSERTADNMFRHPVFVGIREDKTPEDLLDESLKETEELNSNEDVKESNTNKISAEKKKPLERKK